MSQKIPLDDVPPPTEDNLDLTRRLPDHWEQGLVYKVNAKGERTLKPLPGNAKLILANHTAWEPTLRFNAFRYRIEWNSPPPAFNTFSVEAPADFQDHDWIHVDQWFALNYGTGMKKPLLLDAIMAAAMQHAYNPVRDYLDALEWDGLPRVEGWLSTYLGAEETPETLAIGKMWLIQAIARIFQPGCQGDYTLILEGRQGLGKTSALRILAKDWFQGEIGDLRDKDARMNIQGMWIVEIGELDAFKGISSTRIKNFLTQTNDIFRRPYGSTTISHPRQCVFAGTTNQEAYLHDASGGRRFWPVRCKKILLYSLREDRSKLWAEAVQLYKNGEKWWPNAEIEAGLVAEQDARYEDDPWDVRLGAFMAKQAALRHPTTIDEIYQDLEIAPERWNKSNATRIGIAVSRMGWKKRLFKGINYYVKDYNYFEALK